MSRIHDILSGISAFLESRDQSCSGTFRSLAADYAEACREVSGKLEEFQKLIRSGTPDQALRQNAEVTPSWTERARQLIFPGRARWIELCVLYQAPVPPEFDMDLIFRMESGELTNTVVRMADLLARWRVLAWKGESHEKILLLRQMVRTDPDSAIWKKNLEIAENAWTLEQLKEAAKAQKLGDLACLDRILTQLQSEERLHPVLPSQLEAFRKDLQAYRSECMKKQQKKTLDAVEDAYSKENLPELESALSCWKSLSGKEFFIPPEKGDRAVLEEAGKFLKEKQDLLREEQEKRELTAELDRMLEQQTDFQKIREIVFKLQERGSELSADRKTRYQDLEAEYELDKTRKIGLKRLRWVSGILLLCALITAGGFSLVRWREIRGVCREMHEMIRSGKPEAAMEFFRKLEKEENPVVKNEQVRAVLKSAEREKKKREDAILYFDALLKKLKEHLNPEKILLAEKLYRETPWKTLIRTDEQQKQLDLFILRKDDLLREHQEKMNAAFQQKAEALLKRGEMILKDLRDPRNHTPEEMRKRIAGFQQDWKILSANAEHADDSILRIRKTELEEVSQLMNEPLKKLVRYHRVKNLLENPTSLEDLQKGLKELDALGRDGDRFQKAAEWVPFLEQLQKDHASAGDIPFQKDALFIQLPSAGTVRKKLDAFQKRLSEWDFREVCFPDEKGTVFHFLLKSPQDITVDTSMGRAGGQYRALEMTVVSGPDQKKHLSFDIRRKLRVNSYTLTETPAEPDRKAKVFKTDHQQLMMLKEQHVEQAYHCRMLRESIENLKKLSLSEPVRDEEAEKLRQILRAEIRVYAQEQKAHPFIRMRIILDLLDLYGTLSELDRLTVEKLHLKTGMLRPETLQAEDPGVERFLKAVSEKSVQELFQQADRTRDFYRKVQKQMTPYPVGVLFRKNGYLLCRFFPGADTAEDAFVMLKGLDQEIRYFLLPPKLIREKSIPAQELTGNLRKLSDGIVVFAADGSCRDVIRESGKPGLLKIPASIPAAWEEKK